MQSQHQTQHNWLALETANRSFFRYRDRFNGTVVDLGCGSSPYLPELKETVQRYIGVDWENSRHDQSHVDLFSNLNERIALPDASVNAAIAMHVMEHLCEPECFLGEVWRILQPGGFLFIAVPFNWHLHEEPFDFFRYTPYGLEYLLRKHRFAEIEVTPEGGFFSTVTLKWNYQLRRLLKGPLRYFGMPIYAINQTCARWLDRRWPTPRECIAVTAVAVKPGFDRS
jgi:SAM-dependent methyltransferase